MLVCHLWHKLAILAASNAPAVRSHTFLKVGTGDTSANALSPQAQSRAQLEPDDRLLLRLLLLISSVYLSLTTELSQPSMVSSPTHFVMHIFQVSEVSK